MIEECLQSTELCRVVDCVAGLWMTLRDGRFAQLFARKSQVLTRKVVSQPHLAGNHRERRIADRKQTHFLYFYENGQAAHNLPTPVLPLRI